MSGRDLRYWLPEPAPVILILYDAKSDEAYWLYLQHYFASERQIDLGSAPGKVTVHIPTRHRLNQRALDRFAAFRDQILAQIEGNIRHG